MILVMGQMVIGAFDFGPSNALAQTTAVCSNTPNTGERIECTESADSTANIDIDLEGYIVDTTEMDEHGIYAKHEGDGDIAISLEPYIDPNDLTITTNNISIAGKNALGIFGHHTGDGDITMTLKNLEIDKLIFPQVSTTKLASTVIMRVQATLPSTPTPSISRHRTNMATVFIVCIEEAEEGDLNTYVFDSTIATMGDYANGIYSLIQAGGAGGNNYVEFKKIDSQSSRPTISVKGRSADGIRALKSG